MINWNACTINVFYCFVAHQTNYDSIQFYTVLKMRGARCVRWMTNQITGPESFNFASIESIESTVLIVLLYCQNKHNIKIDLHRRWIRRARRARLIHIVRVGQTERSVFHALIFNTYSGMGRDCEAFNRTRRLSLELMSEKRKVSFGSLTRDAGPETTHS